MAAFTCERCHRSPLDASGGSASGAGDSYVVLRAPDANVAREVLPATSMHEQLRTVSRLLDLSETFHSAAPGAACGVPLCEDCASGCISELQRRLDQAHAERELLQSAFAELEAGEEEASDDALSDSEYERECERQRAEEQALREALAAAKREHAALGVELDRLRKEREAQEAQEEARHSLVNRAELERQEAAEEALRSAQLVALSERECARLEGVDVLLDVFAIDVSGAIGTINALRLGRLPGVTVEWSELNAAIGQVALLVHTLARLHLPGGAFAGHGLLLNGSYCKVYRTPEGPSKAYELFGSGRFGSGLFGGGRFERGQTMLLACVGELCGHASGLPMPLPESALSPGPPLAVTTISSLVGAAEGKRLLVVLAWVVSRYREAEVVTKARPLSAAASDRSE